MASPPPPHHHRTLCQLPPAAEPRRDQDGRATSYHLTGSGRELAAICTSLGVWGPRWRQAPPEHRDPALILWGLARLIDPGSLPRPRVVVARFDIAGKRSPSRFWLVASFSGNEVPAGSFAYWPGGAR